MSYDRSVCGIYSWIRSIGIWKYQFRIWGSALGLEIESTVRFEVTAEAMGEDKIIEKKPT